MKKVTEVSNTNYDSLVMEIAKYISKGWEQMGCISIFNGVYSVSMVQDV